MDIKASEHLAKRLDAFARARGLRSRTSALSVLLSQSDEEEVPVASYERVFGAGDTRPVLIVGPSGAGKTTTCKNLLEKFEGPALVVDPSGEWAPYKVLGYNEVAGIDWNSRSTKVRVLLSSDVEVSKIEGDLVFRAVGLAASKGLLRNWAVAIDEGHRFVDNPQLRSLLLEARKTLRKLAVLSADSQTFAALAPSFRPMPRAGS